MGISCVCFLIPSVLFSLWKAIFLRSFSTFIYIAGITNIFYLLSNYYTLTGYMLTVRFFSLPSYGNKEFKTEMTKVRNIMVKITHRLLPHLSKKVTRLPSSLCNLVSSNPKKPRPSQRYSIVV